jgi:hypothetical protein
LRQIAAVLSVIKITDVVEQPVLDARLRPGPSRQ